MARALVFLAATLLGADGSTLRCDVTRDAWLSNVGREADGNNGGVPRLKVKSHQEMSLLDIDPTRLKGRIVRKATLHLKSTGEPRLKRVTVGGIASEWVEGTGTGYQKQVGSSTHNHRLHPDRPWTAEGGDLCDVMFGPGGTLWGTADASPPDKDGWQTVAVDPRVVMARVANVSRGFLVYDDTGTEWRRDGEKYEQSPMPNRFFYSRDQNPASAPYFTVELGPEDHEPPAAPGGPKSDGSSLPTGEAVVSWKVPTDRGGAGTVGFLVDSPAGPLPLEDIPLAMRPGEQVSLRFRDPAAKPGAQLRLTIRAVDGAGNVGEAAKVLVQPSDRVAKPLPPPVPPKPATPGPLPRLGAAEVAILDELDKVHPVTGAMIPAHPEAYLAANHLWAAGDRTVRLHAGKNEFVAFQILVHGKVPGATATLAFDAHEIRTGFGHYRAVESKRGPLPDPITPLTGPISLPEAKHASESLHAEVYVPHDTKPGAHRGTLTLASGADRLVLPVTLEVWDFTLPDHLSFLPEMNCYGLPDNERDYYRLGHAHRVVVNCVPYSHNGKVHEGFAPKWDGKTLDWTAWDRRFGPLFDSSAFADLPRKGIPIDAFYLPLFENWPTPIEPNYNGDYWSDRAFTDRFRKDFVEVSRQIAEHLNSKGWNDTLFECFFNGKNDFKRNGWSRGTSPWLLDEPANYQDFWALRDFGGLFHQGVNKARAGRAKLVFRADISRPQWQRDVMDDVLDVSVVGSAFRRYRRMVLDRKERLGQVVFEYGGSNPIEEPNVQPAAWALDIWTLGADGVLPWQTIGTARSWKEADELSLFYPDPKGGPPVPSVRLKAYRRGQQDVEYLTLYARTSGEPRWAVANRVRETLALAGERRGSGFAGGEDAGRIDYAKLSPADLWSLRVRIGSALSAAHPPAAGRLVDLRTPRREPGKLRDRFVSP